MVSFLLDDVEFTGVTLYDVTKLFLTALKNWDDISKKSNFTQGNSRRFTFEAWMNDFPKSIYEHRHRSSLGELVRFEGYPDKD